MSRPIQPHRTPAWLTKEQRKEMRRLQRVARRLGLQVDHIVPLNHPRVCGLHVPWNLELLTAKQNRYKSNYTWPGDPYAPAEFHFVEEPHQHALPLQ